MFTFSYLYEKIFLLGFTVAAVKPLSFYGSVSKADCLSCFDATVSYAGTDAILLLFLQILKILFQRCHVRFTICKMLISWF